MKTDRLQRECNTISLCLGCSCTLWNTHLLFSVASLISTQPLLSARRAEKRMPEIPIYFSHSSFKQTRWKTNACDTHLFSNSFISEPRWETNAWGTQSTSKPVNHWSTRQPANQQTSKPDNQSTSKRVNLGPANDQRWASKRPKSNHERDLIAIANRQ